LNDPDTGAGHGAANGGQESAEEGAARRRSWVTLAPILVFGVLALIFLVQLLRGGSSGEIESVLIGRPAPATDLAPLQGLVVGGGQVPGISNASFVGKITVLNVWGSWCGPCRDEHPYVLALGNDERIQVVGLNQRDATNNAFGFLMEVGNPYDAIGVDPNGRASIDWGVYGVPESFLIDRNGIVRYKLIGPMNERRYREEMLPQIEALLAEQPAPAA
jgi:cytochrome c biogenesis protein CcmG/thiol:disulfide interchange protein DsbE